VIERTGTLIRKDGGFALRGDDGITYRLELPRVPVDEVEKRVRVTGLASTGDFIDADGVALL
jgi:hypothetical protein